MWSPHAKSCTDWCAICIYLWLILREIRDFPWFYHIFPDSMIFTTPWLRGAWTRGCWSILGRRKQGSMPCVSSQSCKNPRFHGSSWLIDIEEKQKHWHISRRKTYRAENNNWPWWERYIDVPHIWSSSHVTTWGNDQMHPNIIWVLSNKPSSIIYNLYNNISTSFNHIWTKLNHI